MKGVGVSGRPTEDAAPLSGLQQCFKSKSVTFSFLQRKLRHAADARKVPGQFREFPVILNRNRLASGGCANKKKRARWARKAKSRRRIGGIPRSEKYHVRVGGLLW